MKYIHLFVFFSLLYGCSAEQTEEFVFRKVLEYQLKEECGEENKQCIKDIEEQIETCMNKSDWRAYVKNDEDQEEMQRFIREFFPCCKDARGNSYFPLSN